jgi:uncharacterized membrane protein
MIRPRLILVLLYAVAIAQLAWYIPRMPPVLATHYDVAGAPNGWMTRSFALGFHLAMLGVTALAFVGIPSLIGSLAPTLLNIPNREYWLAPERRAASMGALRNRMASLGCATVVLLIVVTGLNFEANLAPPARLSSTAVFSCIGGFLAFLVGWMISLYRRFGPPAAQRT